MKFELYNFNHTFTTPQQFNIGPFLINITQNHCDNLKNLSHPERDTFTLDENFNRVVIHEPKIKSGWINTATAEIDDCNLATTILVPEEGMMNSINDLCNLLTFLTGRRVTTEEYFDDHNPDKSLNRVVNMHNIVFWGNKCWNNLANICQMGLGVPFINLTYACESNEFLGMSVYITSTLNAIYDKWWKKEKLTLINKSIKNKIKGKLRNNLSNSLLFTLKKELIKIMNDENISSDVVEDIEKTISDIGRPSMIYQLKQFLIHLGVYPSMEDDNCLKRLKGINQIRNKLVHSGNILRIKDASLAQIMGIHLSVLLLCLSIAQVYFTSNLLDIKDNQLDSIKKDVIQFFKIGKFSGQDVFKETFDEYLERIQNAWIEEGLFPGINT